MDRREKELFLRRAKAEAEKCEVIRVYEGTKFFPTAVFLDMQQSVMGSDDIGLITDFAKLKGANVRALGEKVLASKKDSVGMFNAQFAKIKGSDVEAHVNYVLEHGDVISIASMANTNEIIDGMNYYAMLERVEELGAVNLADALGETHEYANMYFSEIVVELTKKLEIQLESQM